MAMANTGAVDKVQQSSGRNPQIGLSSYDNAQLKRIQDTHGPENHEFDMKSILQLIENIIEPHEARSSSDEIDIHERLIYQINTISFEILGNCTASQDVQETILDLFNALSSFSWDAKGVIALAAFAVNYGEFQLVARHYHSDPVAKLLSILEQLPEMHEPAESLKSKLESVDRLTKAVLKLTKCVCEFKDLQTHYTKSVESDIPEIQQAINQIPTGVYWIIRSVVICQSQIINIAGVEYESIASDTWELSSLDVKIIQLHDHLKEHLSLSYQLIEERRFTEVYQKIVNHLEKTATDNKQILEALFGSKVDAPLFDGSTKKPVGIDRLGKKTVLLYISSIELSLLETSAVEKIYNESRKSGKESDSQYEVVWLPIVDKSTQWNEASQKQFKNIQNAMPWFSVRQPTVLDPAVIAYIRKAWHFNNTSIIVAFSTEGRVLNLNAMHMMLIWRSSAYPFTAWKEEQLWTTVTWNLDLLASPIEPLIHGWMRESRFICLYGGDDIEWIRKFTTTAQDISQAVGIPLEMLYMGKSNKMEKIKKIGTVISSERLSHVVSDLSLIWLFWSRLESMWHSRVQGGMSPESDDILKELLMMRTFDSSSRGWVIISRGTNNMARAMGDTMLQCMTEYHLWKKKSDENGFISALNEHIPQVGILKSCNSVTWSATTIGVPEKMVCIECRRAMDKLITFSCCPDN